ncbi:glycosyltransferase family 1 protein [Streptacidiphilus sp. PB12-B1b]|uniref:glycosyltransferase n=1 Tax=Streptacidiphilus sp. PB12-B1b TaxID=2705012 RepID=UPI0015F98CE7|nr:nucleotide disphospho-sugar-binding domain-containing protein [Streptacidiphilus sp. PB12-B1b]QMU77263.1 glycosyltransferase family 1 protein [Streptacidiphilus sp. PB12-B1b]
MRILFSSTPAYGHLLPLAPLIRAALAQGHQAAVLSGAGMSGAMAEELPGVPLLAAGPMPEVFVAETARRTGKDVFNPAPEVVGELFAGVRLDLTLPQALPAARAWAPDLVVAEYYDAVGPLLAAVLGVPWHQFGLGPGLPQALLDELARAAAPRYAAHGATPSPAASYLDIWPAALHEPGWSSPAPRRALRPQAHRRPSQTWTAPRFADPDRPRVLVTLGTIFSDSAVLRAVVQAVSTQDVNIVATLGSSLRGETASPASSSSPTAAGGGSGGGRVAYVPFAPMDSLLDGTAAVVGAGGSGTVLAALSRGVPMVLWPQGADQPVTAARAQAAGAAITVDGADALAPALAAVLALDDYGDAARTVAADLAALPDAQQTLQDLTH